MFATNTLTGKLMRIVSHRDVSCNCTCHSMWKGTSPILLPYYRTAHIGTTSMSPIKHPFPEYLLWFDGTISSKDIKWAREQIKLISWMAKLSDSHQCTSHTPSRNPLKPKSKQTHVPPVADGIAQPLGTSYTHTRLTLRQRLHVATRPPWNNIFHRYIYSTRECDVAMNLPAGNATSHYSPILVTVSAVLRLRRSTRIVCLK